MSTMSAIQEETIDALQANKMLKLFDVKSETIPISTLLLFVNIRMHANVPNEEVRIELVSPRVNCRHMSFGRIRDNKFKNELTILSKFQAILCEKVDDTEQTKELIPGLNVFSAKDDVSEQPRFDFSIESKDVFFPLYILCLDLPDGQLKKDNYENDYKTFLEELHKNDHGNSLINFIHLLCIFHSKYNKFKNSQDFQKLLQDILKFTDVPHNIDGINLETLPVILQAVISFQSFCQIRLCIVDGNHRTAWYFCAACGVTCQRDSNDGRVYFAKSMDDATQGIVDDLLEHDMLIDSLIYHKPNDISNQCCVSVMKVRSKHVQDEVLRTEPYEIFFL